MPEFRFVSLVFCQRLVACTAVALLWTIFLAGTASSIEPEDLISELASRVSKRVVLSLAEQAWLEAGHTVHIRLAEIPPYHYFQEEPRGISTDHLRVICGAFAIKYEFNPRGQGTFTESLTRLASRDGIDLLPTLRRSPERERTTLFTHNYIFTPWVIYTRKDSPFVGELSDLHGRTVGVERGYVIGQKIAKDHPAIKLVELDDTRQALESLALGKTDAYVGDLSVGTFLIQRHGYADIKVAAPTGYPIDGQAMGVRNDWPELVSIIDKSLAALTPEEMQQIINKSISIRFEYGVDWTVVNGLITTIVILAGIVIGIWNRRLKSEIEERKQAEFSLKTAQERYRIIIETTHDGIWWLSPDFLTVFANRGMAEMLGYSPEEMQGRPVEDFLFAEDFESHAQRMQMRKAGHDETSERRLMRRDGSEVWTIASSKSLKDDNGCFTGAVSLFMDITERKQIEDALRESKQRFENFTNILHKKILFFSYSLEGEILYLSKGAQYIGGVISKEAIGATWMDIANWTPESVDRGVEQVSKLIQEDEQFVEYELSHIYHDGKKHFLSIYEYIVFSSERNERIIEGIAIDITVQKEREVKLDTLLRAIENAPVSVVITTINGEIQYVNPHFSHVTGYLFEEAIGQNPRILKSNKHDDAFYREMWEALGNGHTWRGEMVNKRKDGGLIWESASISPIYDDTGKVMSYVAVKEEISDKKELERMKEDVERIMRHDLKTPLNAIIGMPQLLEMDGNLTEDQQNLVRAIHDSGVRMLGMIDSSLDLFKMETGKFEYVPRPVNALSVIGQLAEHCRSKLSAKNLSLNVTIDDLAPGLGLSFAIGSEERLLYTLLSNLILNAIEASPQGETVEVKLSSAEPKRIAVCNAGAVPSEVRKGFFDKYKTYGKTCGTGLGTYSAKLYADTMGYDIQMTTSDEDNATRITISVPDAE